MKTVWVVTVFEPGDMTTTPWGVFNNEEAANKMKESLKNDEELNSDGYYLVVEVSSHSVLDTYDEDDE